jgi:hypothetical protein
LILFSLDFFYFGAFFAIFFKKLRQLGKALMLKTGAKVEKKLLNKTRKLNKTVSLIRGGFFLLTFAIYM